MRVGGGGVIVTGMTYMYMLNINAVSTYGAKSFMLHPFAVHTNDGRTVSTVKERDMTVRHGMRVLCPSSDTIICTHTCKP